MRFEVHARSARGGFYFSVFDTRRQAYASFPVGTSGMPRKQTPYRQVAEREADLMNRGVFA